jgi:hypothetical protein
LSPPWLVAHTLQRIEGLEWKKGRMQNWESRSNGKLKLLTREYGNHKEANNSSHPFAVDIHLYPSGCSVYLM